MPSNIYLYHNTMKMQYILALFAVVWVGTATVTWSEVPSLRSGQITTIVSLTTSADSSASTTDHTATFGTPLAEDANLKYGLSLMSYESWMTDTFSFNISMLSLSNTSITIRFLVLDNTFFTRAKVHYLVVWRPGTFPNNFLSASPPVNPNTYNFVDVEFGCYLTDTLLTGVGNRSAIVGGILSTTNWGANLTNLWTMTAISGLQLSNTVGVNDFVKVQTFFNGSNHIYHNVTVQNNNFVKFVCTTSVFVDPSVHQYYHKTIMQYKTMVLTATSVGLQTIPYDIKYDGSSRMFFGFSQFNLTMSDTRYLNVESSNISLISQYYRKNNAMNEVIIEMLFFTFQTCTDTNLYYDPANFSCVGTCPANSKRNVNYGGGPLDYKVCKPCHHSCATCSQGQSDQHCSTCPPNSFRTQAGSTCPCNAGYADVGQAICALCEQTMPGCVTCTSSSVCTSCDNITYALDSTTQQCGCLPGYYLTSGYCLSYSGCLEVIQFNNTLACTTCDSSLNYVRVLSTQSCTCNEGFSLNLTDPKCYDVCGDGITALGFCDDGNLLYGDGCDQTCHVENGYHCTTIYNGTSPGLSSCIIKTKVAITYLYTYRHISSQKFQMHFSISPARQNLTSTSFDSSNFVTNMPIQNTQITYDPTKAIITLEGSYLEAIQGRQFALTVTYANDLTFYAEPTVTQFTATGINAQLTIDQQAALNNILPYIVIAEGILAILLAIFASIVGLKLAGIQLLIPVQLLYFSLAAMSSQTSYSSTLSQLKYSNGYSFIAPYDYSRTYSQNKKLVAITYQSQFLLSTNIMLGIFVVVLLWLLVHHLRIRWKENQLDNFLDQKNEKNQKKEGEEKKEEDGSDESERGMAEDEELPIKKVQEDPHSIQEQNQLREDHHYSLKIFSFEIDRAYFISYMILVNQMLFGFTVMSLNLPLTSFYYAQELSVIVCNFLTFILMANVVFIFYDQTSNKMINFTCINDRYVYLYLLFDILIILVIVYTFENSWSMYVITALSVSFVVLIIVERPYLKNLIQFQNLVALYLAIMLLVSLIMLCVMEAASLTESIQLIMTIIIVALILVGQVLTIIRIILKVNFKKAFDDLRDPKGDRDIDNKNNKRVKEKNLDLLGKDDEEMLPPDSVRNGLFTPKDKMIDWQARNTEEFKSIRLKDNNESTNPKESNQSDEVEQAQEAKESKFNELQLLKKRLRNTLKMKRDAEQKKND